MLSCAFQADQLRPDVVVWREDFVCNKAQTYQVITPPGHLGCKREKELVKISFRKEFPQEVRASFDHDDLALRKHTANALQHLLYCEIRGAARRNHLDIAGHPPLFDLFGPVKRGDDRDGHTFRMEHREAGINVTAAGNKDV